MRYNLKINVLSLLTQQQAVKLPLNELLIINTFGRYNTAYKHHLKVIMLNHSDCERQIKTRIKNLYKQGQNKQVITKWNHAKFD